jgi:hypothetical protein
VFDSDRYFCLRGFVDGQKLTRRSLIGYDAALRENLLATAIAEMAFAQPE